MAEAFVQFLLSRPGPGGLRPLRPALGRCDGGRGHGLTIYPPVEDLFTIDYFGGWEAATPAIFSRDDGVFTQALVDVQQK